MGAERPALHLRDPGDHKRAAHTRERARQRAAVARPGATRLRGAVRLVALLGPGADAALDDVDHVLAAKALQQARGNDTATAGRAYDRYGPLRVELARDIVDVVVGQVDRSGDVDFVPLALLAHVEDLDVVPALVQAVDVDALDRLDLLVLDPPRRH